MVIQKNSIFMVWFYIRMFKILTPYTHRLSILSYTFYDQWNISKLHKIHKYTNILKMISLNYNPYYSCNHFSNSWGCKILCMYMESLALFTVNVPYLFFFFNDLWQWWSVRNSCTPSTWRHALTKPTREWNYYVVVI
jgi:hypothetical protein